MKKLLALLTLLVVLVGASNGSWWEVKKVVIGTLHGSSADTADLGRFLSGATAMRVAFRGDTLKDTVAYYKVNFQFQPFAGTFWTSSVSITSESITLNSEGATKFVSDTIANTGSRVFSDKYGVFYASRMLFTPSAAVAAQGVKTCTAWVYARKGD